MEKEKVITIVRRFHDAGSKTHDISALLPISVDEVDIIRDEYDRAISGIEERYYEHEWLKVQAEIREWIKDIPETERVAMRRDQLLSEVREIKKDPLNPKVLKLIREAKLFTGKIEGVDPAEVLRARDYPIAQLVRFKQRTALCIWHTEKTPSLHLFATNQVHCFGCGKHGDAIDVYMQLTKSSFNEAVQKLI